MNPAAEFLKFCVLWGGVIFMVAMAVLFALAGCWGAKERDQEEARRAAMERQPARREEVPQGSAEWFTDPEWDEEMEWPAIERRQKTEDLKTEEGRAS